MPIVRVRLPNGTIGTVDTDNPDSFTPDTPPSTLSRLAAVSALAPARLVTRPAPFIPATQIPPSEVVPGLFEFGSMFAGGFPRAALSIAGEQIPEPQTAVGRALQLTGSIGGALGGLPAQAAGLAGRVGTRLAAPLVSRGLARAMPTQFGALSATSVVPEAIKQRIAGGVTQGLVRPAIETAAFGGAAALGPSAELLAAGRPGTAAAFLGGQTALGGLLGAGPGLLGAAALPFAGGALLAQRAARKTIGPSLQRAAQQVTKAERVRVGFQEVSARVRQRTAQEIKRTQLEFKQLGERLEERFRLARIATRKQIGGVPLAPPGLAGAESAIAFRAAQRLRRAVIPLLRQKSLAWGQAMDRVLKRSRVRIQGDEVARSIEQAVDEHLGFLGQFAGSEVPGAQGQMVERLRALAAEFRGLGGMRADALIGRLRLIQKDAAKLGRVSSRSFTPDERLLSSVLHHVSRNVVQKRIPGISKLNREWTRHVNEFRDPAIRSLKVFDDEITPAQKWLAETLPEARGIRPPRMSEEDIAFLGRLERELNATRRGRTTLGLLDEMTTIQRRLAFHRLGLKRLTKSGDESILANRLKKLVRQRDQIVENLSKSEKAQLERVKQAWEKWSTSPEGAVGLAGFKLPARFAVGPLKRLPVVGNFFRLFNVGLLTVGSMIQAFDRMVNIGNPVLRYVRRTGVRVVQRGIERGQAVTPAAQRAAQTFRTVRKGQVAAVGQFAGELTRPTRIRVRLPDGTVGTVFPDNPDSFISE